MNPILFTDYYKTEHHKMYPDNTLMIYSNFTPRKSRIKGVNHVVFFGLQHFILEYLIKKFNKEFFKLSLEDRKIYSRTDKVYYEIKAKEIKKKIVDEYSRHIKLDDYSHIEKLWDLGYLPLEIKALPEGTLCPIGVPCFTIKNTHPDFAWLTNYFETMISAMMWQPITSATIAHEYKKIIDKWAIKTTGTTEGTQWQGHDFSMRGMSSIESSILSGMGHLLSFTGTDSIPAIYQLEDSYFADSKKLIGASVPATEHSVMCMGEKETEVETFKRLLRLYPKGILSVVSDTWDLWKVCTEYLPQLKEEILAREGKLVIRPDSGNPVDILCGSINRNLSNYKLGDTLSEEGSFGKEGNYREGVNFKILPEHKGVIELLWEEFGGTVNEQGYKVLDSHIGAIYGDSIGLHNLEEIMSRLEAKGFASTNIVLGFGSYGYQYNTRDTFGFAMKATYGEVKVPIIGAEDDEQQFKIVAREIFKDPITDDGTKRSKKGLLSVWKAGGLMVLDQQSWKEESQGLLETIFKDGELVKEQTLEEIRQRLNN